MTMREEFEAWYADYCGLKVEEVDFEHETAKVALSAYRAGAFTPFWKAAYREGQEEMRERAAKVCELGKLKTSGLMEHENNETCDWCAAAIRAMQLDDQP